MPKLKAKYTKKEDVPENLAELYVEKNGEWVLDSDHDDPAELRAALRAERKIKDELELKIKQWEKAGKTPEEIEALLAKLQDDETNALQGEKKWDELRGRMQESHRAELAKKDQEIGFLTTHITSSLIDNLATEAILAAKGKPKLLLPVIRQQAKVIREGNSFKAVIVDAKGEPMRNDKDGNLLTFADVVSGMRASEDYSLAFEGTNHGGSGTQPDGSGAGKGKTLQRASFAKLPPAEQKSFTLGGGVVTD